MAALPTRGNDRGTGETATNTEGALDGHAENRFERVASDYGMPTRNHNGALAAYVVVRVVYWRMVRSMEPETMRSMSVLRPARNYRAC